MFLQLTISIVIGVVILVFQGFISNEFLFLLILLGGIPHGSLDYGIFRVKQPSNQKQFLYKYILFILAYLAIWAFKPFHALLIFMALSAYHFGQEKLEDLSISRYSLDLILPWGCFVLFFPFALHFEELSTYINLITSVNIIPPDQIILNCIAGALLIWVLYLNYILFKKRLLDGKTSIYLLAQIVALSFLYYLLPLLHSFAFYFIIFHSWNAMKHQFNWMKNQVPNYSPKQYIKDVAPFSILAYGGSFVFLWLFDGANELKLGAGLFIFISLLTLPHMLVFNDFYSSISESKNVNDAQKSVQP
jgi:Brp/Blh family beta-carotene 15,15'-monooxygenase